MIPYYQDDLVTIYHADCREILPIEADAVLTDPPYGIRYSPSQNTKKAWGNKNWTGVVVQGDDVPFDPGLLLGYQTVVLFGGNHYAHLLPPTSEWIVWDKRDGLPSNDFADCELIYTNRKGVARIYRHMWSGAMRASEKQERSLHPTQKPLVLMSWLVERYTQQTDVILDPYMGSGTTLRAAKDLGRKSIGIEIEERYCEQAARRCSQEVFAW